MSMRTIKRDTESLNKGKRSDFEILCRAYTREKKYWLDRFKDWKWQTLLDTPRKIRDVVIGQDYRSLWGLQARHWKLALQDAIETWDKYWQALFVQLKPKIGSSRLMNANRRYAFWLLKGYKQFAELMQGDLPQPEFEIEELDKRAAAGYIRRLVKKHKGKTPSIKKGRSIKFDSSCYTVFEQKGKQFIKCMSLERGKRLVVPLKGISKIEGNITLIFKEGICQVHVSEDLKPSLCDSQDLKEAVDFGYSEVMTDAKGNRYGTELGKLLTSESQGRHEKMQKRHRLHALEKKLRQRNPKKAKNIRKYNLGTKKLNNKTRKGRASIEQEINTAINQFIKGKKSLLLITENLSGNFTYTKSKSVNRKLSCWVRGKLQERVEFKALAEGFRHSRVNPAYGSQTCLSCLFVDAKNRQGDKFKCRHCGHEDIADRVAAKNYLERYGDQEIGLSMRCSQVKTILLDRFHRRLEAEQSATVPDRTLETVADMHPPHLPWHLNPAIAGRDFLANRTVPQRAKSK
jgi:putative transposase